MSAAPVRPLEERFLRHAQAHRFFEHGDRVVIACSGGVDSCVLAHLLRWSPGLPTLTVVLAHFDHRMRPGSDADARWVRGVGAAWELPVRVGVADEPPTNEARARTARYAFLCDVREDEGARWLLTAHHADDQVETVLFRVLRGTGVAGLRGVPERGAGGTLRPLLPFTRAELRAYAERRRVPWREDPSNRLPRHARNVLRNEVLPRVETAVAPGARRALLRLARVARREEAAWSSLYPSLLGAVLEPSTGDGFALDRSALLDHHPGVRARLLRELARRAGVTLSEAGTRAALEFTSSGASGRRISLPGGLVFAREFDRLILSRAAERPGSGTLEVAGAEGRGSFGLGGRVWRAEWSRSASAQGAWTQSFALEGLTLPLRFRGWTQGDRITMSYGSKKLKKLFAEGRIATAERGRVPVLVDRTERVLWVPGIARAFDAPSGPGPALTISVSEVYAE